MSERAPVRPHHLKRLCVPFLWPMAAGGRLIYVNSPSCDRRNFRLDRT